MDKTSNRTIMKAEDIEAALQRLADEIVQGSMNRERLALVGIHTGGVYLAKRIQEAIQSKYGFAPSLGTLDINLYRDDWTLLHTQPVVQATELPFSIENRELVLVDDVLFTGRTIRAALEALMDYGRPSRVQVAVLVDRGHRELPICGQYIGMRIATTPDDHVDVYLSEKSGYDEVVVDSPMAA